MLPGHFSVLQGLLSVSVPLHGSPSWSGGGLSQRRLRVVTPPAHV